MNYNFYRFISMAMLCIFAAFALCIMGSSIYFLHYRYNFGWFYLTVTAVIASASFHFLILKPLFLRFSLVSPQKKFLKRFMKYGSSAYASGLESIEKREELIRKMCARGATNFVKMNFSNLNLSGADFRNTRFTYCLFHNCDLSNVKFEKAFFEGCIFDNANLTNANFTNAIISGVSLHFENAIMTNTCLDNIRILRTVPYQEQLEELCLTELKNNNVIGSEELLQRYTCSSGGSGRSRSINNFLILPR